MIEFLKNNLAVILGSLLVSIISIIGEIILIKLKFVNLSKIKENREKIKRINDELKKAYEKIKKEKEGLDPKILEKQKEILSLNFEIMKEKIKISLFTAIPILIIFGTLYKIKDGFGWWFLLYIVLFFVFDKVLRKLAMLCKIEIDHY
ncbi:MAG TPA: DUF106 domain-containing protein [Nautiliaceae bacterium]|nr:DUF106 domain-containing protein [Nautiliaceae bacterium]